MRGPLAGLLLACFLVPLAQAGTMEAPEVTDPAGDAGLYAVAIAAPTPSTVPPAGMVDVLSAWIEADGADLLFRIRVADLADAVALATVPGADYRWGLRFEMPHAGLGTGQEDYWSHTWMAHATLSQVPYDAGWRYALWDPREEGYVPASGAADLEEGIITVRVPLAMLADAQPGHALTKPSADAGTYFPSYPTWIGDWADEGSDYVVPSQAEVRSAFALSSGGDELAAQAEARSAPSQACVVLAMAILGLASRRRFARA